MIVAAFALGCATPAPAHVRTPDVPSAARPPEVVTPPPADTTPAVPPAPSVPAKEPPWSAADIPKIRAVQPVVLAAAATYDVDPHVLDAIIWHESRFNPKARGPGGAAGLMQLMPSTSKAIARKLGVAHRPYDARFNVTAGAWLLHRLLEIFDGDLDLAVAGYGMGSGAVRKRLANGEPLPEKTRRFISRVHEYAAAFATHAEQLAPAGHLD